LAQCDLLWHQFADDERDIGDDSNHQPDARRLGHNGWNAHGEKPLAQPQSKRGTRKGAGQDTNKRDADLDRREEFARIFG
jgi:hypothetical protein